MLQIGAYPAFYRHSQRLEQPPAPYLLPPRELRTERSRLSAVHLRWGGASASRGSDVGVQGPEHRVRLQCRRRGPP